MEYFYYFVKSEFSKTHLNSKTDKCFRCLTAADN